MTPFRLRFLLAFLPLALFASCASVSLDKTAPPVSPEDTFLTRGRRLYLTTCARCHAPEPVTKYSSSQWSRILPEMIKASKLSGADAAAVTSYVRRFAS
jgi:mono/diheme cytochrome c family protein